MTQFNANIDHRGERGGPISVATDPRFDESLIVLGTTGQEPLVLSLRDARALAAALDAAVAAVSE